MFEKTKAFCQHFLDMGVPGYDLLVYQDGKELLRIMGGVSDLDKQTPITGKEKYNIHSCSKPLTVTAAMQLWEKGLFDLNDELAMYMPEFGDMTVRGENGLIEKATTPIYIHNLFSMTAGFNYDLHSPQLEQLRLDTEGRCPTREVARYLAKEPLHYQPGDRYLYSLGHDVLAALVEVLSGQKFEDYVKENIFDRLGMENSSFLLPMDEYHTVSTLHRWVDAEKRAEVHPNQVPIYRLGSEHASGGAGCVSTVEDYIKFAEALRTGEKLLKRDTIALMTTDRLTEHQRRTYTSPKELYGYGLGLKCPTDISQRTDFGWGGAAGAHLAVDPKNGISLYYAQHMILSPNQTIRARTYLMVIDELYGTNLAPDYTTMAGLTY